MPNPIFAEPWGLTEYALALTGVMVGWLGGAGAHELGHAIAARLVGIHVSALGLGAGRPIIQFTVFGTRVYLARRLFSGGCIFPIARRWELQRWRAVVSLGAGPAVNAVLFVGLAIASRHLPAGFSLVAGAAAIANGLIVFGSLIPGQKHSDGTPNFNDVDLIRHVVWSPDATHIGPAISITRRELPIWDELGERRMAAYYLDLSARIWAWIGLPAEAASALAAAESRRDEHAGPFERAVAALARGAVAREAGQLTDAVNHFEAAIEFFTEADDRDAALFAEALSREAGCRSGPVECPSSAELARKVSLLNSLIALRAGNRTAADDLVNRQLGDDPIFLVWVNRVAAELLAGLDPVRAEAAQRAIVAGLAEISPNFEHPEDRIAHVGILERALLTYRKSVAARGGNESEATQDVLRPIYSQSIRQQLSAVLPDREQEGRRFLIAATVWGLCAMTTAILGTAALALRDGSADEKWFAVAVLFGCLAQAFCLAALFVWALVTVVGRWRNPEAHPHFGSRFLLWLGLSLAFSLLVAFGVWLVQP